MVFSLVDKPVVDCLLEEAREAGVATLDTVLAHLGPATTETLPVPDDCTDGFCGAYWKRPRAYLDPAVRGAISGLALLDASIVGASMERLEADLDGESWHERYPELEDRSEIDLGYRLVVAERRAS